MFDYQWLPQTSRTLLEARWPVVVALRSTFEESGVVNRFRAVRRIFRVAALSSSWGIGTES